MNRVLYAGVRRGYRLARRLDARSVVVPFSLGFADRYCLQLSQRVIETFYPPLTKVERLPRGPRAHAFCVAVPKSGFYQGMDLWKRVGLREAVRDLDSVPYPRSAAA